MTGYLANHPGCVDYLEVIPDIVWHDFGPGAALRYKPVADIAADLARAADGLPVVVHGVGMSIGSACALDDGHLAQLARFCADNDARWHSEHLSFTRVSEGDEVRHAGVGLPVAYDREALDLVVDRVKRVRDVIDLPFLLENGVAYVEIPDQEFSEPAFLNELVARSGCELLLDLHNLYVGVRNFQLASDAYLAELNLDAVTEIHVAGGADLGGMYTDAHAGACPPAVWALLDDVMPRVPNLRGITFEFHHSYYEQLGDGGIAEQLRRAREAWAGRTAGVAG